MKRMFTLFLAALLLTGSLSGCGAKAPVPSPEDGNESNKEPPKMNFAQKNALTGTSFEAAASGYSWNWKNPNGTISGVEADTIHPLDKSVLEHAARTEEPFDADYLLFFALPPESVSFERWSYGDIGNYEAPVRESGFLSVPYQMTIKKGSVYVFHVRFASSDQGGGTADYYLVTGPDAVIQDVKPVTETSAFQSGNENSQWRLDYRDSLARSRENQDGMDAYYADILPLLLKTGEENSVCSPLSIYLALSMLTEAADGSTRQQLLDALHTPDLETLRRRSGAIREANNWDTDIFRVLISDSLWLNERFPVKAETVDTISAEHSAEVFTGDPNSEDFTKALQTWTDEHTGGLLTEYAKEMRLDPRMVMDLVSALYLKAPWSEPFSSDATDDGVFHGTKGDTPCRMMHRSYSGMYCFGDGFAAVTLGISEYGTMMFLLPDEGVQPTDLLKSSQVQALLRGDRNAADTRYPVINLSVPRFDIREKTDLKSVLEGIGVTDAFDPTAADFTSLTESAEVFLSKAEHAAALSIDEEGITGAAYTDLGLCGGGMPQDTVDFTLDRPFLFAVTANDGSILFAGTVRNTDK